MGQEQKISNGVKKLLLMSLLLLFLAGSAQAYVTIIKDYPELPACEGNKECRPGQEDFGLPEYVKYIFIFALGAVGIVGMLALIIAAFSYVMSAGNPQKAAVAKDQIFSALLGLLLLLASWVLLNFINPDLLKLGLDVKPLGKFYTQCYISNSKNCPANKYDYQDCNLTSGKNTQEAATQCKQNCASTAQALSGSSNNAHCIAGPSPGICEAVGCH